MKLRDTIENTSGRAAIVASGEVVRTDEFGDEKLRACSMDGDILHHVESLEVMAPFANMIIDETGDSGSRVAEKIATEQVDYISETLGSKESATQYSKTGEAKVPPDNGTTSMEGELQQFSLESDQETQYAGSTNASRTGTVVKRSSEPGHDMYSDLWMPAWI